MGQQFKYIYRHWFAHAICQTVKLMIPLLFYQTYVTPTSIICSCYLHTYIRIHMYIHMYVWMPEQKLPACSNSYIWLFNHVCVKLDYVLLPQLITTLNNYECTSICCYHLVSWSSFQRSFLSMLYTTGELVPMEDTN